MSAVGGDKIIVQGVPRQAKKSAATKAHTETTHESMLVAIAKISRATTAAPNITAATSSDHGDNADPMAAQKEASATATTGNIPSPGHSYGNVEASEKAKMIHGNVGTIDSPKSHQYIGIKGKGESTTVCGDMNGEVFLEWVK